MFLTLTSRDAESWFRADTYYIRIRKVSPVLLSQCFWWQGAFCRVSFFAESGAFLPSQFLLSQFFCRQGTLLLSQFCWVSYLLTRHVSSSLKDSLLMWTLTATRYSCWGTAWRWVMLQSGKVRYTYTKRFACFCWVSVFVDKVRFCWVSFFLSQFLLSHQFLLSLAV